MNDNIYIALVYNFVKEVFFMSRYLGPVYKKSRRLALISALSSKYQNKELVVVENFDLKTNKTTEYIKNFI